MGQRCSPNPVWQRPKGCRCRLVPDLGCSLALIVGTDDQRISGGFELDLASGTRLDFHLSI